MALDLSDRTQTRIGTIAVVLTFAAFLGTMVVGYFTDPLAKQAAADLAFDFGFTIALMAGTYFFLIGFLGGAR